MTLKFKQKFQNETSNEEFSHCYKYMFIPQIIPKTSILTQI